MFESTLNDWMCLVALETMILVAVGYHNCYVSEDQIDKVAECAQRGKMRNCSVKLEFRIGRLWYFVLAIIATVGPVIYFPSYLYAGIQGAFKYQGLFFGILEVFLALIAFFAMLIVFLYAPCIGEDEFIKKTKKNCLEQYSVFINVE